MEVGILNTATSFKLAWEEETKHSANKKKASCFPLLIDEYVFGW